MSVEMIPTEMREAAEVLVYPAFANKSYDTFFQQRAFGAVTHIFMPLMAIAMLLEFGYVAQQYYKNPDKNLFNTVDLFYSGTAAGLVGYIVTTVALTGMFPLAPLLFLAAIGVMMLRIVNSLIESIKQYRCNIHDRDEQKVHAQNIAKAIIGLVSVAVVAVFVVGAMISPFAPLVVLALGIAAAALSGAQLLWHVTPKKACQQIKRQFSIFAKDSYTNTLTPIPSVHFKGLSSRPSYV